MDDREYGSRLQVARRAKGWTQQELADVIGRSSRMVRLYEKGEVSVDPALRRVLSDHLGDFDAEGDPVEVAVRRSRLVAWRQSDVVSTYQRHLFEQDEAERGAG
jgi:transcriptional regulator with XRE-family HTH domain